MASDKIMHRGLQQALYKYLPENWVDFTQSGGSVTYAVHVDNWNSVQLMGINNKHSLAGSFVVDGDDVCAKSCDDLGYTEKLTGLVHQLNAEGAVSSAHQKSALDHSGENGYVDITARNHASNLLSFYRKLIEHDRRNGYGARALSNHLMLLDHSKDRRADLALGHGDDLVHVLGAEIEGVLAGLLYRDTVRNGGHAVKSLSLSVLNGIEHTGSASRLNAVDLDLRLQVLCRICDSRDQTATADRHYNGIQIIDLVQNFNTDGSLTRNDVLVVEGVHEGVSHLVAKLQRSLVGVVVYALDHYDLGTVALG